MALTTKTYDPGLVIVTFGSTIITGYADGTFVKASRNEDAFKTYVGADGTPARSRSRNRSGSIEITLSQTSPSNDALSASVLADELLGTGVSPCSIRDLNGTTLVVAPEAWVRKPADIEEGKEIGPRTWTIDTGRMEMLVGGNLG